MISLSLTMRLISAMRSELTHTVTGQVVIPYSLRHKHTFFSDQGVVSVVRVISISCRCAAPISKGAKVEFYQEVSPFIKRHEKAFSTYPGTHDQTAQSVLSCAEKISRCRNLGNIMLLLVSNVEGLT